MKDEKPRNFSLVRHIDKPESQDNTFLFLGEIPNMPEHCALAKDGRVMFGYHTDSFVELDDV